MSGKDRQSKCFQSFVCEKLTKLVMMLRPLADRSISEQQQQPPIVDNANGGWWPTDNVVTHCTRVHLI